MWVKGCVFEKKSNCSASSTGRVRSVCRGSDRLVFVCVSVLCLSVVLSASRRSRPATDPLAMMTTERARSAAPRPRAEAVATGLAIGQSPFTLTRTRVWRAERTDALPGLAVSGRVTLCCDGPATGAVEGSEVAQMKKERYRLELLEQMAEKQRSKRR